MDPVDLARYRVRKMKDGKPYGDEMAPDDLRGVVGDAIRAHIADHPEPGTVSYGGREYGYEYREDTDRKMGA